jgi:hypothetical protein
LGCGIIDLAIPDTDYSIMEARSGIVVAPQMVTIVAEVAPEDLKTLILW